MECGHCKRTDQIVATESRSLFDMRDATQYILGCKACGLTWHQKRSWRDRSDQWDGVQIISDEEYDLLFPPKHMVFQQRQHDYDYYMKHGDIGKKFHVYQYGHPSHYVDPHDQNMKMDVLYAFVNEWISDSDELEFVGAFLQPEDFVTLFKFRNKLTGVIYKVPVPPKSSLVWHQRDKMFTVGTFTPKAMTLNMGGTGLLTMNYNILDRSNDKG